MSTFFTSDLHLGHANVIAYSGRPYADVPEMNEAIVNAWNSGIRPTDTVYILGDQCMGKLNETLAIAGRLQGIKLLIPGNHDRCHPNFGGKKEPAYWRKRYMEEAGITTILPTQVNVKIGHHQRVLLCHFPYAGDHTGEEDRYVELRPKDTGRMLVHGHVHDAWRQKGRQLNVALDAWGGGILTEEYMEAWLDNDVVDFEARLDW